MMMSTKPTDFAIGADVSFLRQAEAQGTHFKDDGVAMPGLQILKNHGYNWVRLRLMVEPTPLPNDLAYTIESAKEAKKLGFKWLLCLHLSNDWADPGHQIVPKAWKSMTHEELCKQVQTYCRETMQALDKAGVMPEMVQVGNELSVGMLWPDGKTWKPRQTPEEEKKAWQRFVDLEKAGIKGVEEGSPKSQQPKFLFHLDRGAEKTFICDFLQKLHEDKVKFDVVGLSYYPFWHGSMSDLQATLDQVFKQFGKDIWVVETAYNHIAGEYLDRPAPYPENPKGQRQFLEDLTQVVLKTWNGRGKGVFWWEPLVNGPLRRRGMIDDSDNTLPVIKAFDGFKL